MMSPCLNNMKYLIFLILLGLYKPIYLPLVQFKFASRFNREIFLAKLYYENTSSCKFSLCLLLVISLPHPWLG